MNIAIVTYQDKGAYHAINVSNEDDQLILYLRSKGLMVTKTIWNDPNVDWKLYDLAIIKSPWDYFDLIYDFYAWIDLMDSYNIRLLNSSSILRWNADKHYLKDIKEAGLKITPTLYLSRNDTINLNDYFEMFNVGKLIVKPAVSGGAKNTFKITPPLAEEYTDKINTLLQDEDFIVQPFLQEIEEAGEWSFIFFNGVFSHAILKKAAIGDFRVQSTFGGTVNAENPPQQLIDSAKAYVILFAKKCLYARVDAVIIDSELVLMELELIEPYLFLDTNCNSFENYYQALINLTSTNLDN
jgi:hypothetical protein